MSDIEVIARSIGRYIMRLFVEPWGRDIVRYYRAKVVSPASGGKITVKRPFDSTEISLPCTSAAESLSSGSQCLVLVMGDMSNAIVFAGGKMKEIGSGSGSRFTHVQSDASAVWSIVHNLGFYPSVTLCDASGDEILGDISFADENTLTVSFSEAVSGTAYLS